MFRPLVVVSLKVKQLRDVLVEITFDSHYLKWRYLFAILQRYTLQAYQFYKLINIVYKK